MLINLLSDFWTDLHETRVWWQIAVVTLCVLASYFISRLLRKRFPIDVSYSPAETLAAQAFSRILFPAILWGFLYLGKLVLLKWQHVYLLSLLIPIFGSLALIRFGNYLSRRIFARSTNIGNVHLLIEKIFSWGVWIVAILYYTGSLQDVLNFMDATTISVGRNKLSFMEILQAVISVVVTVLLALWASAALDKQLMKVNSIHTSSRLVLSRLGRSLLIVFAILISLSLVGIDLTVLSVFGGALGVGLGLGLQRIASNYVSGFIILLDRSLAIDDLITVDKYTGKVSKINTRYTVLKGLDGVESVIPNEMLVSSPVQNFSLTDRAVWMSTDLTVAYNTDIEALLPMLVAAASSVERVSKTASPSANLINFGLNGLELRIGFWINDPENGKMGVSSQVNRAIWKLLQEQKVEVPYPQTEIRVLDRGQSSPGNTCAEELN
ncbi:mechanosensitive ion channel family protein [Solimicrobium silvestre]|uniref:Mechanosensitive ion channel n=1 Tax=Solimicrobium silvestre TaxID=2099400 RepID=A0A2S9GWH6_9BURK|nr:mechanosensitive ion channel domain-containing protein [Solimicrobium silvestre]PRC92073.1 Mechanosensitive ion channel [Solimicrobium silvestre]